MKDGEGRFAWGELLIDGGRSGDCADYFDTYTGIIDGSLEVIVETHPDADHIGGLDDMLADYEVEDIWLSGDTADTSVYDDLIAAVNSEEATVHYAQRGDEIELGDLTFEVLNPTLPLDDDRNENSLVLLLSYGQIDFLFAGDVESDSEESMVTAGLIPDIEILKVSHHGSEYCSTPDFLASAQPEEAIISVGASNSYGHPSEDTINRLIDTGATVRRTDVQGTIVVTSSDGVNYTITTER